MTDYSAYLDAMRADGHAPRLYLSAFLGTAVLTGTISATPDFPALTLAYTTSTGSSANVKRGMRIVITTPGGDFKGETSVRYAGTINSTSLPVRELSKGEIDVESGDLLTVYDTFVLTDKLVSDSAAFNPDELAYSDQNHVVAPLLNIGGWWAGPLDAGQAYATVSFNTAGSETVDEDSGATVTTLISAPTATGTTSSTSATPSFTFPAGEHLVTGVGTDSSNSATWTKYAKVKVDADPFELEGWEIGTDDDNSGWRASGNIIGGASLSELPDGAIVALWTREDINTGSRSHIKIIGILKRDNGQSDAEQSNLRVEVISPLARLAELPGFSKVMIRKASPARWREVEGLTVRRAVLLLLRYYTNLLDLFDFDYDALDFAWNRFYLQTATSFEQLGELADGVDGRLVCLRGGRMAVRQHLELLPLSDRAAETTLLTPTVDDVLDLDVSREHHRTVQQLEGRGFVASATDPSPVLARWPGTPGRGTQKTTVDRLIVEDIADLRNRVGMRGAKLDQVFIDSDGVQLRAPEITLTLRGSYDIFDWERGWIELDLDETTNPRGIDLNAFRWLFAGSSTSYDADTGEVITSLRLRAETAAPAAKRYIPVTTAQTNLPPYNPPATDFTVTFPAPFVDVGGILGTGTLKIGKLHANGVIERTLGFDVPSGMGGPDWTLIQSGLFSGTVINAASLSSGALVVLTTTGIYRIADASATTLSASLVHTFAASSNYRNLDFTFGVGGPGLFGLVGSNYLYDIKYLVTADGALTFGAETTLTTGRQAATTPEMPGVFIDSRNGYAYLCGFNGASAYDLRVSTNSGSSFSAATAIVDDDKIMAMIHVPFGDTSATKKIYTGWWDQDVAQEIGLYRHTLPNTFGVNIAPEVSSTRYGPSHVRGRGTFATLPSNASIGLLCATNTGDSARGVFWTNILPTVANSTWNVIITPSSGCQYRRCAFADNDPTGHSFYLYGTQGAIAFVSDGATVDSRVGDSAETSEIVGIFGW